MLGGIVHPDLRALYRVVVRMKRLTSDQSLPVAVIQWVIDTVMGWFGKDPDHGAMK